MELVFNIVLSLLFVGGLIALGFKHYNSKIKTVEMICNNPELTDEKVKSITDMMKEQYDIK